MSGTKHQQKVVPSVAAAIFNAKGEILLQKRQDVNRWCVPSGHVEFGENVEQAILRELSEEMNVKGEIIRLIGIYSEPASSTYFYNGETVQYVTSYFEVKLLSALSEHISNDEVSEVRFFNIRELPTDLALINENWLQDALDKNNTFIR